MFNKDTGAFRTADYGVIASLALNGISPDTCDVDERGNCTMVFTDSAKLREVWTAYRNGTLTGSLLCFQNEVRSITRFVKDQKARRR